MAKAIEDILWPDVEDVEDWQNLQSFPKTPECYCCKEPSEDLNDIRICPRCALDRPQRVDDNADVQS